MNTAALLLSCVLTSSPAFDLPERWPDPGDAPLQIHQPAPGTWILRQSKRSHFEAPFLYLLAGTSRALLLDTGALPESGPSLPLRAYVDTALAQWQQERGLPNLELVVAHSHGHGDHWGNDAQFADRPNTRIIDVSVDAVRSYFGLDDWPEGEAELDLGNRSLTVLPLPGHQQAHVAIYDPQTQTLFSGDTVYPGLITIRDLDAFRRSIQRLVGFTQSHPVQRLLGAHIEMSDRPGQLYPIGTRLQPREHGLAIKPAELAAIAAELPGAGDFRHRLGGDSMLLTQFIAPAQLAAEPAATHGMLLFGQRRLWVSHLPMYHPAHAWQAIAEVSLSEAAAATYSADRQSHSDQIYTVVPNQRWPLVAEFAEGKALSVDLYRGHFERGGTVLLGQVAMRIERVVHLRRLQSDDAQPGDRWLRFGHGAEQYLAHWIGGAPSFDQLAAVRGAAAASSDASTRPLIGPPRPLRVGDQLGPWQVQRVLYTEHGDLRQPH